MTRAVVIYNPVAGASRGERVSRRVAERLRASGWDVERIPTEAEGGATPVAAGVAATVERVVAVGGDGTLREVVEGLGRERSRVVVGLVPMGNANVVAAELGIEGGREDALDVLVTGRPVEMDVGAVRGDDFECLFLAMVGVGCDADTVRLLDRFRRTPLGRRCYRIWADGMYGAAGLVAALRPGQARFTLEADGRPLSDRPYRAASFCNVRAYAKAMTLAPSAHRASGRIHAQARKRALVPFLLWQLGAAVAGKRTPRFISDYVDAARFALRADAPVPVQVDGDARGYTTGLEVSVLPRALRVLAPAGTAGRTAAG